MHKINSKVLTGHAIMACNINTTTTDFVKLIYTIP